MPMSKPLPDEVQDRLDAAFKSAALALHTDASAMVMLFFDGKTIRARRQLADGTSVWVDVGALLGKGDDIDLGVDLALKALYPEADGSMKRMVRIVANLAGRAGGLF